MMMPPLGRGVSSTRLADAAGSGLGRRYGGIGSALPVVAVTDRGVADPVPFVSVITSRRTLGLLCKRAKLFLIPEEYQPPVEMAATERYVALNHQRLLEEGFMHALLDPSTMRWPVAWRRPVIATIR